MAELNNVPDDFVWQLEGVLSDGKTWIIPISPLPFLIGREKDCHLSLSAKLISRYHAEIYRTGNSLWIGDLGSTNGIYINGKRIEQDIMLRNGDVLRFGLSEFRVIQSDSADSVCTEKTIPAGLRQEQSEPVVPYRRELCDLLHHRSVVPFFQPIIQLTDKSTIGFEILGRGCHKGLPSHPKELFEIAKEAGFEIELSQLFWQEGILQARTLPHSPNLFINTYHLEVQHKSLLESLRSIRRSFPHISLTVEIHEKAITDLKYMKELRSALTDLGIGLAYDDFGAGQARFIELIEVPPDYLKFDICLIRGIHVYPKQLYIVRTLVNMAHDLGVATLAEGVECREEGDVCAEIGFSYAQGYHFGKPVPVTRLCSHLRP